MIGSPGRNPGDDHWERLNDYEQSGPIQKGDRRRDDSGWDKSSATKAVQNGEEKSGFWENKVTGRGSGGPVQKGNVGRLSPVVGLAKKIAPTGGIVGLIVGIIAVVMLAPTLLLPHMLEVVRATFGIPEFSIETRSRVIWRTKLFGDRTVTGGIANRYRPMSERTINRLQAQGFDINTDGRTTIRGKTRITAIYQPGSSTPMTASDFSRAMGDPEFRARMNRVYNGRFAAWWDTRAQELIQRRNLGANRAGFRPTADADQPRGSRGWLGRVLSDQSADPGSRGGATATRVSGVDADGNTIDANRDAASAGNTAGDDVARATQDVADNPTRASISANSMRAMGAVSAMGWADLACTVRNTIIFLEDSTKAIRSKQLMQAATLLMAEAHRIKAGEADPDITNELGNMLMTPSQFVVDPDTGELSDPATGPEGQFFGWAAFGNSIGKLNPSAAAFTVGGGGVNSAAADSGLLSFLAANASIINGGACNLIQNSFVRLTSAAVGGYLAFKTGGAFTLVTGGATVGIQAMFNRFLNMVGPQLISTLAGTVIPIDLQGEDMSNVWVSGGGAKYGAASLANANVGMGGEEAVEAHKKRQIYLAQVAEDERFARSPFDLTSRYTFLGSILSNMLPHMGSLTSVSGTLASIGSITSRSISRLLPTANAIDLAKFRENLNVCRDEGFRRIGVAVDPTCNPIMGIPADSLHKDPESVLEWLYHGNYINVSYDGITSIAEGANGNKLRDFQTYCVERGHSLGITADGVSMSMEEAGDLIGTPLERGVECVVQDGEQYGEFSREEKVHFALYFIDYRIQEGIDGDYMNDAMAFDDGRDGLFAHAAISFFDPREAVKVPTIAGSPHIDATYTADTDPSLGQHDLRTSDTNAQTYVRPDTRTRFKWNIEGRLNPTIGAPI